MRKIFAWMLTLAMCISLFGCGASKPEETTVPAATEVPVVETTTAPELAEDVVILYTNDIHTYIDSPLSYDVIAKLKNSLEAVYGNVLLVDAGDAVQGTAYGSMDKGKTIIKLMNAAGYDLATLGNHEFDYGMDGAMNVISQAQFPYVSCNFHHEKDGVKGDSVLKPYEMFEIGGRKIAFVGITTPETFTKSTPAYFQDENGNYIYGISGGDDGAALYADVQAAIDAAKAEGANLIIALGHLGDDPASQPWTSEEVIANVSGLSAFIDGHSHSAVESKEIAGKDGGQVILSQTGEYFGRIGAMLISAEGNMVSANFIEYAQITEVVKDDKGEPVLDEDGEEVTEVVGYEFVSNLDLGGTTWASDETVAAMQDAWIAEIDSQLGQTIGSTELIFDNYDADGKRLVRSQETNSGDFAAVYVDNFIRHWGNGKVMGYYNYRHSVDSAAILKKLQYKTTNAFYAAIGEGIVDVADVKNMILEITQGVQEQPVEQERKNIFMMRLRKEKRMQL